MMMLDEVDAPGKSDTEVLALYEMRRRDPNERWRNEAIAVRDLLNGDIFRPVSERFGENEMTVAANFATISLDQMARRTVSTQPNVRYTAIDPGKTTSDQKARKRQLANLGWWDRNNMKLLDRKRARWLQGFGSAPMQVGPGMGKFSDTPKWTLRDPLTTFAGPTDFQDSFMPTDCIYAFKRSFSWVKACYPDHVGTIVADYTKKNNKLSDDTMFEFVEYVDDDERICLLVGRDVKSSVIGSNSATSFMTRLDHAENLLEMCPVVAPHLINIDRIKSPYFENVGMELMRNKLAALEYLFAERSVFPERYFVEPPNSPNGEIVQLADGPSGTLGHLRGGDFKDLSMPLNFAGTQMSDRLEAQERIMNSTPSDFTGQSGSNIRTGKRGQDVVSAAIDFTIQETQEILSMAKEQENRIAVAVYKKYINKPTAFYFANKKINYGPDDFESDENHVFYASAGNDVNQLVISGGQRIAQQTMSRETFLSIDPLIEDVEAEKDLITSEQLHQSILTELLQPGTLDVVAKARIAELVKGNQMELPEAIAKIQQERQEAQASSGQPGDATGPVAPGAPEAQPGIAPTAAQPTIGPTPDQQGLSQALSALRRPQMSQATGA